MADGAVFQPNGIDGDMPDALPFPGVGHLDHAIAGLDDGGVGELAGFILEKEGSVPAEAVAGKREVDPISAAGEVVVKEGEAAVAETDCVDAGVVVGQIGAGERRPSFAGVGRPGLENHVLA